MLFYLKYTFLKFEVNHISKDLFQRQLLILKLYYKLIQVDSVKVFQTTQHEYIRSPSRGLPFQKQPQPPSFRSAMPHRVPGRAELSLTLSAHPLPKRNDSKSHSTNPWTGLSGLLPLLAVGPWANKKRNHSVPQFPPLQSEDISSTSLLESW